MRVNESGVLASQVRRAGYCTHPIRLRGRVDAVDRQTGELHPVLDTSDQPGGELLVACRNRRSTVCPACSEVYRGDAWQIIAAGLRGGKGVPDAVASHPRVFVTLTAPSFGPVHSRRLTTERARRCRPRRTGNCEHGLPRGCRLRHGVGEPVLGQPLCSECFDYHGAVLWNAHAGALWNRTAVALRRRLAQAVGLRVREFGGVARLSFIKVVEYQARGVVHLHAVVRLDGSEGGLSPPPASLDAGILADAFRDAAAAATVPFVTPDGSDARAVWGRQLDVRLLDGNEGDRTGAVAGYIAKYATKSTDAVGALDHRIRTAAEIDRLVVNAHLRRLATTCWQLGADPRYRRLRLRAWAHTLGYRGHWTTKSRHYSTTFTALRDARMTHARGLAHHDPCDDEELLGQWRYSGRGYSTFATQFTGGTE